MSSKEQTRSRSIDETISLLTTDAGASGPLDPRTRQACEEVESWTKAGRFDDLVTLAGALESACPPLHTAAAAASDNQQRSAFETVADHVEDQLALATGAPAAAVDALLGLSLRTRTRSVSVPRDRALRVRAFASRLGFGQTKASFLSTLERLGEQAEHRELLACWMHETVLRGTSLEDDAGAKRFRDALVAAGHPLGKLPLALRPAEREAPSYMPLYGDKGLGRAIERLTSGAMSVRTMPPPADGAVVRAKRVEDAEVLQRMRGAVEPWSKLEAHVFELAPPVESGTVGSWLLRALPLESTTATARLDCSRTGPEGVFGPLFSAGSNGGAYSAGLGGAYGRRAAWASLGALVGAPANERADVSEIEALANGCTFLTFTAAGPWFFDVAWDLGVLAVRGGGASVAVLAATDTD